MTAPQDVLPPRLRLAFVALSEFPTTNGIKVSGLILMFATAAFLAVASMFSYTISESVLAIWLSAVLFMMGLGNWAMNIKRNTPLTSPPGAPDAEAVAATKGTPAPANAGAVLTREDAELAARAMSEGEAVG